MLGQVVVLFGWTENHCVYSDSIFKVLTSLYHLVLLSNLSAKRVNTVIDFGE